MHHCHCHCHCHWPGWYNHHYYWLDHHKGDHQRVDGTPRHCLDTPHSLNHGTWPSNHSASLTAPAPAPPTLLFPGSIASSHPTRGSFSPRRCCGWTSGLCVFSLSITMIKSMRGLYKLLVGSYKQWQEKGGHLFSHTTQCKGESVRGGGGISHS